MITTFTLPLLLHTVLLLLILVYELTRVLEIVQGKLVIIPYPAVETLNDKSLIWAGLYIVLRHVR